MKIGSMAFEQMFEIVILLNVMGQRSKNNIDLLYSQIYIYKNNSYYQYLGQSLQTFHQILCISIFHIRPCRNKSQGRPKIII